MIKINKFTRWNEREDFGWVDVSGVDFERVDGCFDVRLWVGKEKNVSLGQVDQPSCLIKFFKRKRADGTPVL